MTSKDGKHDPQDTSTPNTAPVPNQRTNGADRRHTTPALFPMPEADRSRLHERLYSNVKRIEELQAQLRAITNEKREEIKKLKATVSSIIEEIENEG